MSCDTTRWPTRWQGRQAYPRVSVILCSYRGETHLQRQLDSIAEQTWPVSVEIHDDASDDTTVEIARSHNSMPSVVAHENNLGYVGNFARAIAAALHNGADYIALADQDDIWEPDRIAAGMQVMLETEDKEKAGCPILIHSDLSVVDDQESLLHASYMSLRGYALTDAPDLAKVVGENGVMGNTCLVNRALATLSLPFPPGLHVHDWWLAILAELYGRRRMLQTKTVAYRVHSSNASNPAGSLAPSVLSILGNLNIQRLKTRDFRLPFKEDTRALVIESLLAGDGYRPQVPQAAKHTLEAFVEYLNFATARARILMLLLRYRFLRKGIRHRVRVAFAVLLTGRYDK